MPKYAQELFLLSANLSQFKSKVVAIKIFIESLNSIFEGHSFCFEETGNPDNECIEVCTAIKNYGYITFSNKQLFTDETFSLFQNAVQLLALIIEKLEQEKFLQSQKEHLQHLVDEKTQVLEQRNKELEENEQRLRLAAISGQLGIWDWNISENRMVWNEKMFELYGIAKETHPINIDTWKNRLHPADKQQALEELNNALEGLNEFDTSFRIVHPDGTVKYIKANGLVIKDNINKPYRMLGINRDITDIKLAEQELVKAKEKAEESEEKLRQLAENTNDVFWLRTDEKMLYINPAFERIFGIPCDEIYENPHAFTDLIHPEDKPVVSAIFQSEEFKKKGIFNYDYRIIRPDNEIRWINARASAILDEQGKVIRRVGSATDITEKKKTELELIAAKERAEESDRLKTAFLQNISHEIRTPMNAIMGFSELLNTNLVKPDKQKYYTSIIIQRCEDLLVIIDDILNISKIESGQLPLNNEVSNISVIFSEIYQTFVGYRKKIEKEHISLEIIPSNIPSALDYILDSGKLKQIFNNLINNAFKFTEKGKINFGYRSIDNEFITFFVSDTGIGIPADKFDVIFERFSQINQEPSRLYGGTGLGLSIVKGLLYLMGGNIWLESEPGKGSAFYFTVPCKQARIEASVPIEQTETSSLVSDKRIKLLIVEDDIYNLAYLKEILETENIEIIYAQSGEKGIELALSSKPDIILMDIRLPGITGYEAIKRILTVRPEMKIIAQTAYASASDKEKALELGCKDYISKPLTTSAVIETIQKHLYKGCL